MVEESLRRSARGFGALGSSEERFDNIWDIGPEARAPKPSRLVYLPNRRLKLAPIGDQPEARPPINRDDNGRYPRASRREQDQSLQATRSRPGR